jgi:hypothetical protein
MEDDITFETKMSKVALPMGNGAIDRCEPLGFRRHDHGQSISGSSPISILHAHFQVQTSEIVRKTIKTIFFPQINTLQPHKPLAPYHVDLVIEQRCGRLARVRLEALHLQLQVTDLCTRLTQLRVEPVIVLLQSIWPTVLFVIIEFFLKGGLREMIAQRTSGT